MRMRMMETRIGRGGTHARRAQQQHRQATRQAPTHHPPPSRPFPSPFRLWHFLQMGKPPIASGPDSLLVLVPQPTVKPLRMELAQWYAQRVAPRAQQLITQLIDLRRLRYAIEMNGEGFAAPTLPGKHGRPHPSKPILISLKHTTLAGGTADGTAGYVPHSVADRYKDLMKATSWSGGGGGGGGRAVSLHLPVLLCLAHRHRGKARSRRRRRVRVRVRRMW